MLSPPRYYHGVHGITAVTMVIVLSPIPTQLSGYSTGVPLIPPDPLTINILGT